MSTLHSDFISLGPVSLPAWRGRQLHMRAFHASFPELPEGFEDYLAVISALCAQVGHTGVAYLTVDEKVVQAGMSQRRPGVHVDGTWVPEIQAHGQPSGHRQPERPGGRHYRPGWGGHRQPDRGGHVIPDSGGHSFRADIPPQPLIVAASVPGCLVYPGSFDAVPKDDGDLEHIRHQLGGGVLLPADAAFLLSPDCVHESIRFSSPTQRTFMRIALEARGLWS